MATRYNRQQSVRMTYEMFLYVHQQAKYYGMSMSEYVRTLIEDDRRRK